MRAGHALLRSNSQQRSKLAFTPLMFPEEEK
jgi:hypothetical protein